MEIVTDGLVKKYQMGGETILAVNGVHVEVEQGSFVSVTGKSGSGKSTFLHLIGGIDRPDQGKILLGGKDITAASEKELTQLRRDYIGFVFQRFCLVQELSVQENILFPALLKSAKADWEYYEYLVERLELKDRTRHMPSELSGGQQQRVAIARALINRPHIVLCDEPTGNLDQKTSDEVLALLMEMHEELKNTMVIVTHDQEIARRADHCIVFEDGKVR